MSRKGMSLRNDKTLQADSVAGTIPDVEPSSKEVWKLLVEMNSKLEDLVTQYKKVSTDLEEIRKAVEFNDRNVEEVKESILSLTDDLRDQKTTMEEVKASTDKLASEMDSTTNKLDELEQYTRKNSLEIHGIPTDGNVESEEVVLKIARAIDVEVESSDIEISHRLKVRSKTTSQPIIVKFLSHKKKNELLYARRKLKDLTVGDIFEHLTEDDTGENRIFINENLTSYRRKLFGKLLSLRRKGTIFSTWTIDGKIFMKKSEVGIPILIKTDMDIDFSLKRINNT